MIFYTTPIPVCFAHWNPLHTTKAMIIASVTEPYKMTRMFVIVWSSQLEIPLFIACFEFMTFDSTFIWFIHSISTARIDRPLSLWFVSVNITYDTVLNWWLPTLVLSCHPVSLVFYSGQVSYITQSWHANHLRKCITSTDGKANI